MGKAGGEWCVGWATDVRPNCNSEVERGLRGARRLWMPLVEEVQEVGGELADYVSDG